MMYQIATKIVVQAATIELDGASLVELAAAREPLSEAVQLLNRSAEPRHAALAAGLAPVQDLLGELAAIVEGATAVAPPAKKTRRPRQASASE